MAQAGYTPISLYYSTTASAAPDASNLVAGELALNTLDEKLYFKNSAGTVKLLASSASTTNVQTISFGSTGLTPSTATSGAVTVAGTLAVGNGGTGITSFGTGVAGALGQNVSGSGSIALTTSPVFTTPNLGTPSAVTLTSATGLPLSTGVTGTLAIGNGGTGSTSTTYCSLTTNVTGTLPVANGGTGVASATAYALLAGGKTTTGAFQSIASVGTSGQVLTSNGAGALPTFQTASGGVTTISFGSTGLTPSTATSGAVTVAGTLAVANGGTGATTSTGSGAVVLATSPTLVTPVLGTPSSGTLTNCTGLPVAGGGTGRASHTAYAVICGGTTTTTAQQSIASVGTTGQVLTSNGAGALPTFQTPAGGAAFPSGTRMSFQQTSAPTGWTKDTTAAINDAILRLVTGSVSSGGTTAFSTWNAQTATGATTLSISQIPSHDHSGSGFLAGDTGSNPRGNYNYANIERDSGTFTWKVQPQGGGGSHNHSLTQSLKYYDFIIASAN
jgi:hypothetical protein